MRYNVAVSLEAVDQLAAEIVGGDPARALETCARDAQLAYDVSHVAAELLVARAAAHVIGIDVSVQAWPRAQSAIVAFAALPGVDGSALAAALLRCCIYESVSGEPDQLQTPSLQLILDHHPDAVRQLVILSSEHWIDSTRLLPPWPNDRDGNARFLLDALWTLEGEDGVRWMNLVLDHNPRALVSSRPLTWTPQDWTLRLLALSERAAIPQQAYALDRVLLSTESPAPREALPALARYCCARHIATDSPRWRIERAASVIASHRTEDPAQDVGLFWWEPATPDEIAALRWLLELTGPAGARVALVDAAFAGGLIGPELAEALAADFDRPLWADRDVPWIITSVLEAGALEIEDGLAFLGPAETSERDAWCVAIEPGRHAARVIVAVHPVHGRANAAVEIVVDAAPPERWEAVAHGSGDDGLGVAGRPPTSSPPSSPEGWTDGFVRHDDGGPIWLPFPATPGRELWVGRDGDRITRVVLDLGRMALDPATDAPPWFVHDRVPVTAGTEALPEIDADTIGAPELRDLIERRVPLRQQRATLHATLRQRGISEYSAAVVLQHVRDGVALVGSSSPAQSRLGGPGRLPPGLPWPRLADEREFYPALLAEIAFAELPPLDPLPRDGTLLIFQETEMWSLEQDPLVGTRVFYVPEGVELHEPPQPEGVLFPLARRPIRGVAALIPGDSERVVDALEFLPDRELVIDTMNELWDAVPAGHWLLGAPNEIQGSTYLSIPHELARLSDEHRATFKQAELDGHGWTLLAQINEDHEGNIVIGDGGSFYLFIPETDLRERRFDRVIGMMQCH
jgi:hypothetical protein